MASGKLGPRRPLNGTPRPVPLPLETTPMVPANQQVEGSEERIEAHRRRVEYEAPREELNETDYL